MKNNMIKQVLIFIGILILCAVGGFFLGKLIGAQEQALPPDMHHHCNDPHCSHSH